MSETLVIQQAPAGLGWSVLVALPNGKTRYVRTFRTLGEAETFIVERSGVSS